MTTVPWQDRSSFHNVRWLLLLLTLAAFLLYPFAQDYLRAASLLQRISDPHATGWIANYDVHPVEVRDSMFEFKGTAIPARIYMPRGVASSPGIVVVHGMHELGINEPRLVNFARALASTGFFVMTPQVPGIADYRVQGESAELIGTAAQSFAQRLQVPKVGVLAFSFSGGLALVAASDPRYSNSIAWIAVVGAHHDLARVLRFFASGEAPRPDGTVDHIPPHGYGPLIVVYNEVRDFFTPQDAQTAHDAIKLLLSENVKASEQVTATMSLAGQQTMQLIYHKQREHFAPTLLAEIDKRRQQLAAASPAGHLKSLPMPVALLHGSDDTVIPPTELLWLQHEVPKDKLLDALTSPAITHVEVGSNVSLRERLTLVHWMALVIREARTAEPSKGARLAVGAWIFLRKRHIDPAMVTLEQIKLAQRRLLGIAACTPLIPYFPPATENGPTQVARGRLWLKPESLQPIGSFKLRGAYNKIASLTEQERRRGVISYSSGNHAQGVAYAARAMGVKSVIVMPRNAPRIKVESTAALGAEIVTVGPASSERLRKAEELAREHGYTVVPPYNDEQIIAGQGTVGLEILKDCPDVDLVLVPSGGGGLISGISAAIKLSGSKAKIVGVEPELANDAQQSFRKGEIVELPGERVSSTLADGLRTQSVGPINFEHIRHFVDDMITVTEDEIRTAMRRIISNARIVSEPSGAVTFAAWLFHAGELPESKQAVAVVTGGNVELELLAQVLSEEVAME
jgi:threonine dehydratase